MEARESKRPSRARQQATVRAPTLKEALKEARARYGDEARIIESRAVRLRQEDGLGQERLIEVIVQAGAPQSLSELGPRSGRAPGTSTELLEVIDGEVARIERLVQSLSERRRPSAPLSAELLDYPLSSLLLAEGTTLETVRQLAGLFAASHAPTQSDLPTAVSHLRTHLRAGSGDWAEFAGCHVFLGDGGAGKSELVLGLAARMSKAGRNVLVLNLLPKHGGEVRRLQLEAAAQSYDAAIIQRGEQITRLAEHLAAYEVVLIDTPALFTAAFSGAGDLQRFIAQNETFHRHFVVPLDLDLREGGELWEAARLWNCDWIAATRLDRCRGAGKLLDLQARLQLPFSVYANGPWPEQEPVLAKADALAALIVREQDSPAAQQARA